ncbi:MAG: TlpA disulfide reductase family protein [Phycisphaerales bacterium]
MRDMSRFLGVALAIALALVTRAALADPAEQRAYVIELITPGGPLPAVCELQRVHSADGPDVWSAHFKNAKSVSVCHDVRVETTHTDLWNVRHVRIEVLGADSVLEWSEIDRGWDEPARGSGTWTKRRNADVHVVDVIVREIGEVQYATLEGKLGVTPERFGAVGSGTGAEPAPFAGRWSAVFKGEEDPCVAQFEVDDHGFATGTFITTTGDYRYLSGRVDGDLLRLSSFDARDSYLFHARLRADGTIAGDFWSGTWWHDTWTATRDENASVNDGFSRTEWRGGATWDQLVFRTLDGDAQSVGDALDDLEAGGARATLLLLFGSWCANCADAIEYLKELEGEHAGEGLRVLGLAFEYTGDMEHDARQVRLHEERQGTTWPVLVAGVSDKKKASEAMPVLDRIRAFPTVVFLDSSREPIAVYSGFEGPATGEAYERLRARWEALIGRLLGESP